MSARDHRVTDRSHDLRSAIEASGYYPDVVADAVFAAVAGEAVEAHLVHHEPTIDERDEVRRHVTVLVLTPSRMVLAHTDDHAPDDLLPSPYTSSTTEAVSLSSIRNVVVSRMVTEPDARDADPSAAAEAVLTIGWGASGRIDLEPAICSDPGCEADHGYTGLVASDDFSLRVSAAAEGPGAVRELLDFAAALSARTSGGSGTAGLRVRH
jgi:hypothetical protein